MNEWSDQAVILRMGLFHEANLWLKVLTRARGILTLFAFGGARSKRRFCGCLDIFNTLDCHVATGRRAGYMTLKEAELLAAPRNLRKQWRHMGIAVNCLRFMEAIPVAPESAGECFMLVEDLRATLERGQAHALMTFFFRLRVASALGFSPSLDTCGKCGQTMTGNGFFIPADGQVFCPACVPGEKAGNNPVLPVSAENLRVLATARRSLPSAWKLDSANADIRACAGIIDSFIQFHVGLVWEKGSFRRV